MIWVVVLLKAAVLAISLSIDAFAASFAYGCKKITIPMASLHTINLICACVTGLSILFGSVLVPYIPEWLAVGLSFAILFLIGISKLFDSITKCQRREENARKCRLNYVGKRQSGTQAGGIKGQVQRGY